MIKLPSRLKAEIAQIRQLTDPKEVESALKELCKELPEKYHAAIMVNPRSEYEAWKQKKQELTYSGMALTEAGSSSQFSFEE